MKTVPYFIFTKVYKFRIFGTQNSTIIPLKFSIDSTIVTIPYLCIIEVVALFYYTNYLINSILRHESTRIKAANNNLGNQTECSTSLRDYWLTKFGKYLGTENVLAKHNGEQFSQGKPATECNRIEM